MSFSESVLRRVEKKNATNVSQWRCSLRSVNCLSLLLSIFYFCFYSIESGFYSVETTLNMVG